jgi:hypothetical protein
MLNNVYNPLLTIKSNKNSYTFNRIKVYNIVIAYLLTSITSNNSAAIIAKNILYSFLIKIRLIVRVGKGI